MTRSSHRIKRIPIPTPFLVGNVNVYLLIGEQNVLIDTGPETEDAWNALTKGLKEWSLTVGAIHHVLLTHGHEDHCGLAGRLGEAGACIHLPENESTDRKSAGIHHFYRTQLEEAGLSGTSLEDTLQGLRRMGHFGRMSESHQSVAGTAWLRLGGSVFQAIPTPGHTPGHTAYLHESTRVLFCGDCFIPDMTPYPMLSPDPLVPGKRFHGLQAYLKTFEDLKSREFAEACSGHRGCLPHLDAYMEKALAFYESRQKRILSILEDKAASAFEIASGFYPGAVRLNHFLVVSEALAHLDYLETQGRIGSEMRQGVRVYGLAETDRNKTES